MGQVKSLFSRHVYSVYTAYIEIYRNNEIITVCVKLYIDVHTFMEMCMCERVCKLVTWSLPLGSIACQES